MAPLLLDTCAVLWIANGEEISEDCRRAVDEAAPSDQILISPITAWEIGILSKKGRFKSRFTPQHWFEHLMSAPSTALAPLTPEILLESSFLPGKMTDDPADRIIAATAREYGYTVMTRDKALLDYGSEGHLSVLEC